MSLFYPEPGAGHLGPTQVVGDEEPLEQLLGQEKDLASGEGVLAA